MNGEGGNSSRESGLVYALLLDYWNFVQNLIFHRQSIQPKENMMSTIGLVSSSQTNYEVNAKAYGPVVAGAVGIVEAAGDAVSAVCSFSAESLSKLNDAAESGLDSIGDAFSDVTDVVGDAIDAAEAGATQLYNDIASLTEEGLQVMGDMASSAVDGISSAAASVGVAATVSVAAGKA